MTIPTCRIKNMSNISKHLTTTIYTVFKIQRNERLCNQSGCVYVCRNSINNYKASS